MDLLCNAYSNASDDEPESDPRPKSEGGFGPQFCNPPLPLAKRPKLEYPFQPLPGRTRSSLDSDHPRVLPGPGRYISKRERALLASVPAIPDSIPNPNHVLNSAVVLGSISDSYVPSDVLSSLRHRPKGCATQGRIPSRLSIELSGHTKAVNALDWSASRAHLLASAGLDNLVCIWNVWSRCQKKVRVFDFHNAPVKDVKWSPNGFTVLSCGYDYSSKLIDVEKGLEVQSFKEDQIVGSVKFSPDNYNLFLSGGSTGSLRLWDIRAAKVVHEYIRDLGPILDLEFMGDGRRFISSSNVSSKNVSENAIIVWDISREIPLSNQVYAEAFTCPCIKRHPFDSCFVAQSNGNYIAIFSSVAPFKLNKYKRYESHGVSGFPINCNFSSDGKLLVSGSSDGCIYFYDYESSELTRKVKAYDEPCIDVAFHPSLPNVIASCSWTGNVSVFSDNK